MKLLKYLWRQIKSKCKKCVNYRPDKTGFNGGTCIGDEYLCIYRSKNPIKEGQK